MRYPASTTGPLPGAVPVEALDGEQALVASVWRWPFDPLVPGLERAVTPGRSDDLVGSWVGAGPTLEVVAYRPTERAVVRPSPVAITMRSPAAFSVASASGVLALTGSETASKPAS